MQGEFNFLLFLLEGARKLVADYWYRNAKSWCWTMSTAATP
ncbi:MAG: hypothetical protein RLZZ445_993 [Pseudomonadota bacterium]|jgi:hypothetical protein